MRVNLLLKRAFLFLLLALTLGVAAVGGISSQNASGPVGIGATVARADDCDGPHPPPGLDCPGDPTPTPTPLPGN